MTEDTTKDTACPESVRFRPLAHNPVLASIIRGAVMAGGYENCWNVETVALAVLNAVGDLPDGHLKEAVMFDLCMNGARFYVERAMEVEYRGWVH